MRRSIQYALLALVVCAVAACESKPTAPPAETPPATTETPDAASPKTETPAADKGAEAPADPKAGFKDHMKEHFGQAITLRNLLIAGDLEGAREPAKWLADKEKHGDFPEAWNPHAEKMHVSARRIAEAKTLDEASREFGQLGNTCAECHVALGAKPKFPEIPMPSGGQDTKAHMQRHAWGVSRLWEGLIGPSEERWSLGAVILAEGPLHEQKFIEGKTIGDKAKLESEQVHKLGQRAAEPTDGAARTAIYGELISACSGCHNELWPQLGRKPGMPVEVPAPPAADDKAADDGAADDGAAEDEAGDDK